MMEELHWDAVTHMNRAIRRDFTHGISQTPNELVARRLCREDAADEEIREIYLESMRQDFLAEYYGEAAPFKRATGDARGIYWGNDLNTQKPFVQSEQALRVHLLASGLTGSGKSTLATTLLLQMALCQTLEGMWATDCHKQEFRHLRRPLSRAGRNLIVLRRQDWRLNLLQPFTKHPSTSVALIADVLARSQRLPDRARHILTWAIEHLYERFGVSTNAHTDYYPTLHDLFELIARDHGHLDHMARHALLDRLGTLLTSMGPEVLAHRVGWSPMELAKHWLVLEFGGQPEIVKQVVLTWLLQTIRQADTEEGVVNAHLRHLILLDDAQRLLASQVSDSHDLSPLAEQLGLLRSTGRAIAAFVQSLDAVPRELRSNFGNHLLFCTQAHHDLAAAASDMGLAPQQLAWARDNLRPGVYIARIAGSWRHPVALEIPKATLNPDADDAEVERSHEPLKRLRVVRAPEFENWQFDRSILIKGPAKPSNKPGREHAAPTPFVASTVQEAQTPAVDAANDSGKPSLSPADLALLAVVVDHPGLASSDIPARAGISPKRALVIRERLVQAGYLRVHKVSTGAKGGRRALVLEALAPAQHAVAAWRAQSGAKP